MPIITPTFTICAPPKCGSTWLNEALLESGIPCQRHHTCFVHELGQEDPDLPRIVLVRPVRDWLHSIWGAKRLGRCGIPLIDEMLSLPKHGPFDEFMDAYRSRMNGQAGKVFKLYRDHSDHVVKLSGLPLSLVKVIDKIGWPEGSDRDRLLEQKVRNET